MALTNFLDPTANPDVVAVSDAGGEILQLNLDSMYSILLFAIYFIQSNFVAILIIAIITWVSVMGLKKYKSMGKGNNKVA